MVGVVQAERPPEDMAFVGDELNRSKTAVRTDRLLGDMKMEKWETLTIDQMSRANAIVQRLVKDCVNAWNGKRNGHTAFDTYNRVEEIHAILNEERKDENKIDGE